MTLRRRPARLRVRFQIIRNARTSNVGKSQSCMVSKLRIIWKRTRTDDNAGCPRASTTHVLGAGLEVQNNGKTAAEWQTTADYDPGRHTPLRRSRSTSRSPAAGDCAAEGGGPTSPMTVTGGSSSDDDGDGSISSGSDGSLSGGSEFLSPNSFLVPTAKLARYSSAHDHFAAAAEDRPGPEQPITEEDVRADVIVHARIDM